MKVFVTGATGVLGRATVFQLVAAGYDVVALCRSEENEILLKKLGAVPFHTNLFNLSALEAGISNCDIVLHLATKIPRFRDAHRRKSWLDNDKIRREGTRILVNAALANRARTFIYPSVCFFYSDQETEWIDETSAIKVPELLQSTIEAENHVVTIIQSGGRGIVLRMGGFYGPDAGYTKDIIALAKWGISPIIGKSTAYLSQIWVDDAASAIVSAIRKAPSGIYNIVDDDPLQRKEVIDLIAQVVGKRRLSRLPDCFIRIFSGTDLLFLGRSQRISNRKFKEASGWLPMVRNAKIGWAKIMEEIQFI